MLLFRVWQMKTIGPSQVLDLHQCSGSKMDETLPPPTLGARIRGIQQCTSGTADGQRRHVRHVELGGHGEFHAGLTKSQKMAARMLTLQFLSVEWNEDETESQLSPTCFHSACYDSPDRNNPHFAPLCGSQRADSRGSCPVAWRTKPCRNAPAVLWGRDRVVYPKHDPT